MTMVKAYGLARLTKDPELRYSQSGTAIAKFGIAHNERTGRDGEKDSRSHFFDCVVFGSLAETVGKYCEKGTNIVFEGDLQQDRWEDKEGKRRSNVEIKIWRLEILWDQHSSNKHSRKSKGSEGIQPGPDEQPQEAGGCPF